MRHHFDCRLCINFAAAGPETKKGSRAWASIRLHCRGPGSGEICGGNQFVAISVYESTGLERFRERVLSSPDFPNVARGTINADIKSRTKVRETVAIDENPNQNPTDQDY
jgi:hypothetical protein